MEPRLTELPAPAVAERLEALVHGWCGMPRDICRCDPRPLPEPKPSGVVRALQRGRRAEIDSEPLDDHPAPDTRGTPETAPEPPLSPISALFPGCYRTGGAA